MEPGIASDVRVVAEARANVREQAVTLVVGVGITAMVAVFAATGLESIPSAVLWLLAGAMASDTISMAAGVVAAWREWRRLRRCPGCRARAIEVDGAWERYEQCSSPSHRLVWS